MNLGVEIENGEVTVTTVMADAASFKRILETLSFRQGDFYVVSRNGFCKFVFPYSGIGTIEAVFDLWIDHFETGEIV